MLLILLFVFIVVEQVYFVVTKILARKRYRKLARRYEDQAQQYKKCVQRYRELAQEATWLMQETNNMQNGYIEWPKEYKHLPRLLKRDDVGV